MSVFPCHVAKPEEPETDKFWPNFWAIEWKSYGHVMLLELAVTIGARHKIIPWDKDYPYFNAIYPAMALTYFLANWRVYVYYINLKTSSWNHPQMAALSTCQLTVLLYLMTLCPWERKQEVLAFMSLSTWSWQWVLGLHTVKVAMSTVYLWKKALEGEKEKFR